MSVSKPSALSPLNRALFWTRLVMIWERLLPALFPYVLLVALIAVAAQWGLFLYLPSWLHAAMLSLGLLVAIFASFRAVFNFRMPTFTELNTRVAVDNGLKPERILAMRHQVDQPPLRVGKAKAGIAQSDPFALRFVALVAAVLGFLVLGPVPWSRVQHGFMPFAQLEASADMHLARK
ncbi:DUF4175 family protein [Asticcacaulis sp. AC402]|uniref:DUF4175 family protein n=1 Tax=Asticcacaulis sp. AC402 TaxID=1282361 RepID=UPI0003C3FD04|nr:DUF4175 family protein [Asticcacaulis sp. AC402]ESQ77167.1 hypothetical protein ABAC402_01845 [Asticcacaulis sp. AC402]